MPQSTSTATGIVGHRQPKGNPLPIPIRDGRRRVVGTVCILSGRLVLFAHVDERVHLLRQPRAWARDRVVLEQARRADAVDVVLEDRHAARRWTAPLAAFEQCGISLDRGHGPQVALPLDRWRVEDLRGPVQVSLPLEVLA